jgi:hypothetical protein
MVLPIEFIYRFENVKLVGASFYYINNLDLFKTAVSTYIILKLLVYMVQHQDEWQQKQP